MVTKLVSGVASRKPPLSGWIDANTRSVRACARLRISAREPIARGRVMVNGLPDGDECGQRVTHHRQLQRAEELVRERGQFEGKAGDFAPRDAPANREVHEDRHGERAVFSVTAFDG